MTDVRNVEKLAADLEKHLGAPQDLASVVGWATALDHDDREAFHHEGMAHLQEWGLHEYQVPATHGGRAVDVQDSLELFRLVARRDPSLATSLATTSLSFMPVWVAGTDAQKEQWVKRICHGTAMSWGLSEAAHGSDIVADETRAELVDGGYVINGEKWPIGNSAIGEVIAVFARTGERVGPAAFSILMVDRRSCPASAVRPRERIRLHGLRSIDNGGVAFVNCRVPDSARIGAEGAGMEIAVKAALAVRALAPAMALGCVDSGLRLTLDFVSTRMLFGETVIEVPYTRRQLVDAFADLLVADAVATGAVRALQAAPDQVSITSSVSKYLVPTMLEATMGTLSTVLGARHFVRSDPHYGVFHKFVRDLWISHFAEGNVVVNLKNIVSSLRELTKAPAEVDAEVRDVAAGRSAVIYDFDATLPQFEPARLQMRSRHGDDVVTAMPGVLDALEARAEASDRSTSGAHGSADHLRAAVSLGRRFVERLSVLRREVEELAERYGSSWPRSDEAYRRAEDYAVLHAAAAVVALAAHSAESLPNGGIDPAVLLVCLGRLWERFEPGGRVVSADAVASAAAVMLRLHREGRLFSHRQLALAEGSTPRGERS
ncbi:acyl-CoA dehydrogenase family protein [Saccharopolyspora sp. NPDC050389]|uniref:acyl-CoA dehydrogenase family protein n=1 Tax=Saccharopolyspora sp. NPDC050389 TaxID=3155516 RepID=UPI0034010612